VLIVKIRQENLASEKIIFGFNV